MSNIENAIKHLEEAKDNMLREPDKSFLFIGYAIRELRRIPPVKRGEWTDNPPKVHSVCSVCKEYGFKHYDYCPWCGADMRMEDK